MTSWLGCFSDTAALPSAQPPWYKCVLGDSEWFSSKLFWSFKLLSYLGCLTHLSWLSCLSSLGSLGLCSRKKPLKMGFQLSKYFRFSSLRYTQGPWTNLFVETGYSSCSFLTKETDLTKGHSQYQWPLWGTLRSPICLSLNKTGRSWLGNGQKWVEFLFLLGFLCFQTLPGVWRWLFVK